MTKKMDLEELFPPGGRGVIATSALDGAVNTAVYSRPHITGPGAVAWGMTDGRTWANVRENPKAAFLYMYPGPGYAGVRVGLLLERVDDAGGMLEQVKARTAEIVSPAAATAVRRVAYFRVVEVRPLV